VGNARGFVGVVLSAMVGALDLRIHIVVLTPSPPPNNEADLTRLVQRVTSHRGSIASSNRTWLPYLRVPIGPWSVSQPPQAESNIDAVMGCTQHAGFFRTERKYENEARHSTLHASLAGETKQPWPGVNSCRHQPAFSRKENASAGSYLVRTRQQPPASIRLPFFSFSFLFFFSRNAISTYVAGSDGLPRLTARGKRDGVGGCDPDCSDGQSAPLLSA